MPYSTTIWFPPGADPGALVFAKSRHRSCNVSSCWCPESRSHSHLPSFSKLGDVSLMWTLGIKDTVEQRRSRRSKRDCCVACVVTMPRPWTDIYWDGAEAHGSEVLLALLIAGLRHAHEGRKLRRLVSSLPHQLSDSYDCC